MSDEAAEERWAARIIDAHLAEVAAGTTGGADRPGRGTGVQCLAP